MQTYNELCSLSKRAHLLDGISSHLGWDQETYMPKNAAPIRAMQKEILAELSHTIKTSKEFETTLAQLIDLSTGQVTSIGHTLDDDKKASLRAWRRDFLHLKKLPTSFVQEFTKLTSEAIFIWDKAKQENNFSAFEPHLNKIVEMLKKKADYLGYEDHPYDALLDSYEPEFKTKDVEALFNELSLAIPPLLVELIDLQKGSPKHQVEIDLSADEQMLICKKVLQLIGYDFNCGRIDLSSHPFSSAYHPYDARITTRLESHGLAIQVLTTLHEAGHSFYEMGLPPEHFGTPLADPISHGIHENESRTWETRIGRTLAFWQFLHPIVKELFPKKFDHLTAEELFSEISCVKPSFIRTDSDEVTYPLHVILRFQIEKELIEGSLKTKDVPARWNEKMRSLLGITPANDREGCLQDIHWSMGGFGYFPTYTLGNIYAAELFEVFAKEHPNWQERIKKGDFDFIKEWRHKNVHQHGRRYTSKELLEKITGKQITANPYINYLTTKYRSIFTT